MRTILLTGFEPFGGEDRNASQEIIRRFEGAEVNGYRVITTTLPCEFGRSGRALRQALHRHRPDLVVCLGQAAGRTAVTPERVALNLDDAPIPDNAGNRPLDTPVIVGGPAALWSGLPVKVVVAALRARNIPAEVSQTAGTYVCNHVFYILMHALRRRRGVRGGFIHVPCLEGEVPGRPGLPLASLVGAVRVALEVCLEPDRAGGGAAGGSVARLNAGTDRGPRPE